MKPDPNAPLRRPARRARGLAAVGCAVFLAALTATTARASTPSDRIAPSLARLGVTRPDERVVAWVYFTDRAGAERDVTAAHRLRRLVSERALDRRLRRGAMRGLDVRDLPVHAPYVRALVARGARVRGTSRWLDAASVEVPARLVAEIARLPFVARIEPVWRGRRIVDPEPAEILPESAPPSGKPPDRLAGGPLPGEQAYYGGAFRQLDMMQVPAMHALGLTGAGVLVCMLDTGFETTHAAYAGLDVVAARDFINLDDVVANEAGDPPSQSGHGTLTLACVAGSLPGTYSGGAFGASLALGKTENVASETPVEMDYWQFGAEWADSMGADIISSSLGYSEFQDPMQSYTYDDMDGRTTVVTLAAAEAVRRGITVINSAGNAGATPWLYIIAPADADTLIAVGAVDSLNVVVGFSSRGPSADGRIKPDVTAMGYRVLSVSGASSYVRVNGTSFSCPLTAGVAALLLEAHPGWRPFEVREALRETALNHATPNNDIGWGLVQGLDALAWVPSTTGVPKPPAVTSRLSLAVGPNPIQGDRGATLRFAAPAAGPVTVDVFDASGRRRARVFTGSAETERTVRWEGRDAAGASLGAGIYWVRLSPAGAAFGARPASVRVVLLP